MLIKRAQIFGLSLNCIFTGLHVHLQYFYLHFFRHPSLTSLSTPVRIPVALRQILYQLPWVPVHKRPSRCWCTYGLLRFRSNLFSVKRPPKRGFGCASKIASTSAMIAFRNTSFIHVYFRWDWDRTALFLSNLQPILGTEVGWVFGMGISETPPS